MRAPSHFSFGRNWADYAAKITRAQIEEAERCLLRLLGCESLDGVRFLDIGSGSGLHSLAALRLGAGEVVAIDLDPDSVVTTRAMLESFAPSGRWRVEQASVFGLTPERWGNFDIVYSWGVLHHTGDLRKAMRQAAAMATPGGLFVFALYRRIWLDWFWRWEKRWYAQAAPKAQVWARAAYVTLFKMGLLIKRQRFSEYVDTYRCNRGMDFSHDVHDWMGGWPYESVSSREVHALMQDLDFVLVRRFTRTGRFLGRNVGWFGSGCDEYVYRRGR